MTWHHPRLGCSPQISCRSEFLHPTGVEPVPLERDRGVVAVPRRMSEHLERADDQLEPFGLGLLALVLEARLVDAELQCAVDPLDYVSTVSDRITVVPRAMAS
jgi:hypothetical protein